MTTTISAKASILEVIGRTPVIRLAAFSRQTGCEVYAKLENLNPGGSHKARIAMAMVLDAERRGILERGRGQTIIEPSGGNTGIGLAIAGAILGYRVILVIPDNYSPEKQYILKLYGAELLLSDSRRGNNSHGLMAMEIQIKNPDYVMLNQQRNPANPEIHRRTTAEEIFDVFGSARIDCFVAGIGTGGHITGIGERLKDRWPLVKVLGVEPEGCDLLNDHHACHEIQGLSVGIIPDVLNLSVIDRMVQVSKEECLNAVKQVMRNDGVNLGISSGANFAAIQKSVGVAITPGSVILTMIYDGIEPYLSYFSEAVTASEGVRHDAPMQ